MNLKNKSYFFNKIPITIFCFLSIFFFTYSYSETIKWNLKKTQTFIIKNEDPDFGGISSIIIDNNGKKFEMLSDKGIFFKGEIIRDENEKILDLNFFEKGKLLKSNGESVDGRNIDSEGMTKSINNDYFISFESNHRIMYHEKLNLPGRLLSKHSDFKTFEANKGIEALAINSKNYLYAIPELPSIKNKFPIYIFKNNKWTSINEIEVQKDFQITDADFLNDEQLIILERELDWVKGFRTLIRLINIKNNEIINVRKIFMSNYNSTNNEGISIWNTNNNNLSIKLTTISDNNFLPFIETVINEYELIQAN